MNDVYMRAVINIYECCCISMYVCFRVYSSSAWCAPTSSTELVAVVMNDRYLL